MGAAAGTAGLAALGGPMAMATMAAGAGIAGGIKADRDEQKNDRRTQGKVEDASLRNEANYRMNRALLMTGIEDFYKKKGWKLPEQIPGAGTSRSLPGDAPLYPQYNTPKSDWAYPQQQAAPAPAEIVPAVAEAPIVQSQLPAKAEPAQSATSPIMPAGMTVNKLGAKPALTDDELSKLLSPYGYF